MTPTRGLSGTGLEERVRSLEETHRATLNILADFDAEKTRFEQTHRASLNVLEDFDAEKARFEQTHRATLNILDDFDREKARLEDNQRATLNILEDSAFETQRLEQSQRAVLNILDDFNLEKDKVEEANRALTREMAERERREEQIRKLNRDLERRAVELQAINSQLEGANKELEAFSYSVSHDLRAPLRHIDGFSRILMEEAGQLSPEAQQYFQRIRHATRQMAQMVDDLLALARVGRLELSRQITGLGSLVEEVRRNLGPEMGQRRIEWRVGDLPFVECDPALMKQVYANLLSNAVKYTRPRDPALIEAGSLDQNGERVFYVRDNGVGFSMKYADKLFGVFQRLHRAEDFEGTGVGLATVQRIIHKHGGRIWAEAELGKGAAFYFTLGPAEAGG